MDIFTKINLLSSIGLISSSIGIGTLNGSEETSSSENSALCGKGENSDTLKDTIRSLREKVEEIENTLQEDPGKKNLKGTINIDGITYEISSKIYRDERTTTIASYFQGRQLVEKEVNDQLNYFIVRSTIMAFISAESTEDMKKTAIENLCKFYKSEEFPGSDKSYLLQLLMDSAVGGLIQEVKYKDYNYGNLEPEYVFENRKAAMELLGILYTFPLIPKFSEEKIARFYLKTCRDIAILYTIIRFNMNDDQKETLWALNKLIPKEDVFIITSYRDIRSNDSLLDRLSPPDYEKRPLEGKATYYKKKTACYKISKRYHMASMLILSPEFFHPHNEGAAIGINEAIDKAEKTPNASNKNIIIDIIKAFNGETITDLNVINNDQNTTDRIQKEIEKSLKKIQNKLEQPSKLAPQTYDEFKEQLELFKSQASKIVELYNQAYDMVLIANACAYETQSKIYEDSFVGEEIQTYFGSISGAIQRGRSEWLKLAEEIKQISEKFDTVEKGENSTSEVEEQKEKRSNQSGHRSGHRRDHRSGHRRDHRSGHRRDHRSGQNLQKE
jgi:hypothetical protein